MRQLDFLLSIDMFDPLPETPAWVTGEGIAIPLRLLCLAAFVFLVLGIFYGGAQPVAVGLFPDPYDKLVHFAVFFTMTLLAGLAGLRTSVSLLLLGLALGAGDELHQLFLPGRSACWEDFAVDVCAVMAAVCLLPQVMQRLPGAVARG